MSPRPSYPGLLLLVALTSACPGDVTYIEVELQVDDSLPNPFQWVKTIRLEATGPEMSPINAEAPVNERELWLPPIPLGPGRMIAVDGLDADRVAISHGQTPQPFDVTATEPPKVTIPFRRCVDTIQYKDYDRDGHGNSTAGKTVCVVQQEGYVSNKDDCDDGDSRAHPGQTSYFDTPSAGTQSFDYNCDGKREQQFTALAACVKSGGDCTGDGWETAVPDCGQDGSFVACKPGSCTAEPATTKKQACR